MVRTHNNERESSIELLRILSGMAVVILHFNYLENGGVLPYAKGITYNILMFFEILCIPAVNVFILISGYFSSSIEKIRFGRLASLIVQTSVFSFGFKLISCIVNGSIELKNIMASFLPVNYYVILYCTLMCFAPFINKMLESFSKKTVNFFIVMSILLLSVYPTIVDVIEDIIGRNLSGLSSISTNGSLGGYSIINFILIYTIGNYLKRVDLKKYISNFALVCLLIVTIAIIWIWRSFLPETAFMYSNPFVIIESIIIFLLFSKNQFKNKLVNTIAPASFTCYLIHGNILSYIGLERFAGLNTLVVIGALIIIVLGCYFISFFVMKLWVYITRPIFERTIFRIPDYNLDIRYK